MFILKVSENAKKKHRNAWLGWMRENQSGWGTNDPEPQAPKDKLACSIPPQPVPCPTGLFMTKTELWKMWCKGRDAAPDAAEPSAEESADQRDAISEMRRAIGDVRSATSDQRDATWRNTTWQQRDTTGISGKETRME